LFEDRNCGGKGQPLSIPGRLQAASSRSGFFVPLRYPNRFRSSKDWANSPANTASKVFHEAQQKRKLPIRIHGEPEYLENFNDSDHGYLRVTVTRKKIALDYVAVPDPSENARDAFLKPYDTVEVAL